MRCYRQIMPVSVLALVVILAMPSLATAPKRRYIPEGTWGGLHARLVVGKSSATIDYDCAHGTIDAPLNLNANGKFSLRGSYFREHGGPIRKDETNRGEPAIYTGWTDGKTMVLTVVLADTKEKIGTYTLTRGQPGRVYKCM